MSDIQKHGGKWKLFEKEALYQDAYYIQQHTHDIER